MPNIYIILISSVLIAISTAWVVIRTCYSAYFRKKIASEHGFVEGFITGAAYPLLWVAYGLEIIQFISFIAFQGSNEILIAIRLLLFLLTAFAFFVLQSLTPPLVALWFGKTAFWDRRGESGKHQYTDIYGVKVHKKKTSTVINSQQIYKLTFFVKDKFLLLIPKKFSCKMTAHNISALAETVDFKNSQEPSITKKSILYSVCVPIFTVLIATVLFLQTIPTGIFNPNKYTTESTVSTEVIKTESPVTDVVTDGARLYVFYGDIGAINVYNADGSFNFALSLPYRLFNATDIAFYDGQILYKTGNELFRYSDSGSFISKEAYLDSHNALFENTNSKIGEKDITFNSIGVKLGETQIVKAPIYSQVFAPRVLWPVTALLFIALFGIKIYASTEKENEG